MYIEIYLDVLILTNYLMILTINILALKFLKKEIKKLKLALVSLFIAGISTLFSLVLLPVTYFLIVMLILSFNGLLLFDIKSLKELLKVVVLKIILSILVSGIIYSIKSFVNNLRGINNINMERFSVSIKILLISSILSFVVLKLVQAYIKHLWKLNNIYLIKLRVDNRIYLLKGFLDTGNKLYDTKSMMPVCIVEESTFNKRFLQTITDTIDIKTVSNEGRMSIFRPSYIILENKKIENVMIGLTRNKLSQSNTFTMLLHPDILF